MKIVQKKKSHKHIFTFHEDTFTFAYQSKHGSGELDLDYMDVAEKPFVQIERNDWLRNVGYIWLIVGGIQLGIAAYAQMSLAGRGVWILLGVACLAIEYFSRVKFTVFHVDRWNVHVIQDKHHDQIVQTLKERKKEQLLKHYADIDPNNSLEMEINKFRWLVKEGALTQEESDTKIAQVERLFQEDHSTSDTTLN